MAEKEYIEREAIIKELREDEECDCELIVLLYDYPAADVAPVKHGEWIQTNVFECSECEYSFEPEGYLPFFNYCPNCGAKMDGGEENENTEAHRKDD